MTSGQEFDRAFEHLRRELGFGQLTPEEAKAAYDAARPVPLSAARIDAIVKSATGAPRRPADKPTEWREWSRRFPLKAMRKFNFSLPDVGSDVEALLGFFGVPSPEAWQNRWKAASVAYRQTQVFDICQEAVAAWVREAEIVASGLTLAAFDHSKLRSSLAGLRQLTRKRIGDAVSEAQEVCSRAGVAMVVVPELPGTRISGCARWLTDQHALVGLTIRYKMDDQFWFTFFHEIGHVLLHLDRRSFVIDNVADDFGDEVVDPEMVKFEEEANRFAADTLIPPDALSEFIHRDEFTNDSIHDFAERIGVGPGIVVGRLQREGKLKRHQGNKLKQKLEIKFASEDGEA